MGYFICATAGTCAVVLCIIWLRRVDIQIIDISKRARFTMSSGRRRIFSHLCLRCAAVYLLFRPRIYFNSLTPYIAQRKWIFGHDDRDEDADDGGANVTLLIVMIDYAMIKGWWVGGFFVALHLLTFSHLQFISHNSFIHTYLLSTFYRSHILN